MNRLIDLSYDIVKFDKSYLLDIDRPILDDSKFKSKYSNRLEAAVDVSIVTFIYIILLFIYSNISKHVDMNYNVTVYMKKCNILIYRYQYTFKPTYRNAYIYDI